MKNFLKIAALLSTTMLIAGTSGCGDTTFEQKRDATKVVIDSLCPTAKTLVESGVIVDDPDEKILNGLQVGCLVLGTIVNNISNVKFDTAEQSDAFKLKIASSRIRPNITYTLDDGSWVSLSKAELDMYQKAVNDFYSQQFVSE